MHSFPGGQSELSKAFQTHQIENRSYSDNLQGYIETGDNLLVNRFSYAFCEPARGDIAVFETKGLSNHGDSLGGQFYIKRLVGIPGDTLKITKSNDLFIKAKGESDFKSAAKIHPSMARVMTKTGGYNGYIFSGPSLYLRKVGGHWGMYYPKDGEIKKCTYPIDIEEKVKGKLILAKSKYGSYRFEKNNTQTEWQLRNWERTDGYSASYGEEENIFTLADKQYLMMGDNSANSSDGRMWGPVPRKNFMGTALGVFWPFSNRWGLPE